MAGIGQAKVFADGQLPASKAALYTVPIDRMAYVRFFSVANTASSGSETVKLYINASGTSRLIYSHSLAHSTTNWILAGGETIVLEGGDIIEGQTTTGSTVDYVICGVEER